MTQITLGSKNPHKLLELEALLADYGVQLASLPTSVPDTIEDRDSFRGNAEKKACEYARATGSWALADDSGLCVNALGGAPGVFSARFAGEPADHGRNNALLLDQMRGVEASRRGAEFVCVLALADPQGLRLLVEGRLRGRIAEDLSGRGGFGYDPLFIIDEPELECSGRRLAELEPAEKNAISHRGRALRRLLAAWPALF